MKRIQFTAMILLSMVMQSFGQTDQYGPYIGGNGFLYKSNLYNAHDVIGDSIQKYKMTMGFGVGFDFGFKWENGVSLGSGLFVGTNNQNYSGDGVAGFDIVKFTAKTTMTNLKIPLLLSMQTRNDKDLKAFYSVGLFYSYNMSYAETSNWDYLYFADVNTTISKNTITTKVAGDSNKYESIISERPYKRHAWGAIFALGASKRYNKNSEWFVQARMDYQISSSENNDELIFTPAAGSVDEKRVGHVFGNYSKYLHKSKATYNRPATHPFSLGITFGIRYYLFDFEK